MSTPSTTAVQPLAPSEAERLLRETDPLTDDAVAGIYRGLAAWHRLEAATARRAGDRREAAVHLQMAEDFIADADRALSR